MRPYDKQGTLKLRSYKVQGGDWDLALIFINAILEHGVQASIAQLGERQTEDLKVPRSIRGRGIFSFKSGYF